MQATPASPPTTPPTTGTLTGEAPAPESAVVVAAGAGCTVAAGPPAATSLVVEATRPVAEADDSKVEDEVNDAEDEVENGVDEADVVEERCEEDTVRVENVLSVYGCDLEKEVELDDRVVVVVFRPLRALLRLAANDALVEDCVDDIELLLEALSVGIVGGAVVGDWRNDVGRDCDESVVGDEDGEGFGVGGGEDRTYCELEPGTWMERDELGAGAGAGVFVARSVADGEGSMVTCPKGKLTVASVEGTMLRVVRPMTSPEGFWTTTSSRVARAAGSRRRILAAWSSSRCSRSWWPA
jgi:hypothetical protein